MPQAEVVSSAILKIAAGTPVLVDSLTPDALLTEVSVDSSIGIDPAACCACMAGCVMVQHCVGWFNWLI